MTSTQQHPGGSILGTEVRRVEDPELLVGDPSLTLNEGVILPWNQGGKGVYSYFSRLLSGPPDRLPISWWLAISGSSPRSSKCLEITLGWSSR